MFSRLSSHLAISMSSPKPTVLADIYGRPNISLVRSIARAILAMDFSLHDFVCACVVITCVMWQSVFVFLNNNNNSKLIIIIITTVFAAMCGFR